MNLQIKRFGGQINPEDNSIQLFISGELFVEIEGQKLTKGIEMFVPVTEVEIYNLCYLLQPLVFDYCQKEFFNQNSIDPTS